MAPKILVIDDSKMALDWARQILSPQGFEVITSDTALGTHAAVMSKQPDLVLLDVGMPGLSGDILCKLLKENPRTKDKLVILYSSLPEDELKELAKQSNADGYIKKTEDTGKLVEQINGLLGIQTDSRISSQLGGALLHRAETHMGPEENLGKSGRSQISQRATGGL